MREVYRNTCRFDRREAEGTLTSKLLCVAIGKCSRGAELSLVAARLVVLDVVKGLH